MASQCHGSENNTTVITHNRQPKGDTQKSQKESACCGEREEEWKRAGRKFLSFERLRRGQLPSITIMLRHKTPGKKKRNVITEGRKRKHPDCAPKGVPHRREQRKIRGWKDEKEIQIVPPI